MRVDQDYASIELRLLSLLLGILCFEFVINILLLNTICCRRPFVDPSFVFQTARKGKSEERLLAVAYSLARPLPPRLLDSATVNY